MSHQANPDPVVQRLPQVQERLRKNYGVESAAVAVLVSSLEQEVADLKDKLAKVNARKVRVDVERCSDGRVFANVIDISIDPTKASQQLAHLHAGECFVFP